MVSFSVLFRQLTDFVYYHKQNHMIIIDNIISIMIIVLSLLSIYWPLSTFVEILVMRHFFANTDGLPKPVQICSRIAGLPRNLGVALQKCKLPRQDAMRLVGGAGRTMDRLPAISRVRIWTWLPFSECRRHSDRDKGKDPFFHFSQVCSHHTAHELLKSLHSVYAIIIAQ